jgi:hypothetical protein
LAAFRARDAALAFVLPVLACGGAEAPPPASPQPIASVAPMPPPDNVVPPTGTAAAPTQEQAHRFFVLAASCWLGGVWADALGEQDSVKQAGTEARCREVERRIWDTEDNPHYEQLRALETGAIADVVSKVDELAKGDSVDRSHHEALTNLTRAFAEAQKETMLARRAADRVKRDLAREPEKLSDDEVQAVAPLRAHSKIEALYSLDAGPLSKEAHALALLCALDHVELARGLPKHLKLYAVADEYKLLFDVNVPDVPTDATKKLVPGTWLGLLSDVARAAGHPVSERAKTPREKDALAWAGMLEGFSDKLKADVDGISSATELNHVVTVVLHRLEQEYRAQQAVEGTKQTKASSSKR